MWSVFLSVLDLLSPPPKFTWASSSPGLDPDIPRWATTAPPFSGVGTYLVPFHLMTSESNCSGRGRGTGSTDTLDKKFNCKITQTSALKSKSIVFQFAFYFIQCMYWKSFIVNIHISTSSFLNCLDEFYNMALLQLVSKGMVKYTFDFLNFSML